MKTIGSQKRETLSESGYRLYSTWPDISMGCVVLIDDTGKKELWALQDDYSGYVIEIEGRGYEFLRTLTEPKDLSK